MKSMIALVAATLIAGVILAPQALAQRGPRWKGSGGWGPGNEYGRLYNPRAVATNTGEVIAAERITPMKGMCYGIHIKLITETETLLVHLGPGWFIENQDVEFNPKDKVEVVGSRIMLDGKPAIIASEVGKGDELLKLRDENGFPVWAGWRKGTR
jgi:hypothetical protein